MLNQLEQNEIIKILLTERGQKIIIHLKKLYIPNTTQTPDIKFWLFVIPQSNWLQIEPLTSQVYKDDIVLEACFYTEKKERKNAIHLWKCWVRISKLWLLLTNWKYQISTSKFPLVSENFKISLIVTLPKKKKTASGNKFPYMWVPSGNGSDGPVS